MSNDITLARPYARAAFDIANEAGDLDAWSSALLASSAIAADAEVQTALQHPGLSVAQAVALIEPQSGASQAYQSFLHALAEARRLTALPQVQQQFEHLRAEAEKRRQVTITSAAQIDAEAMEKIKAALAKRFGTSIEITEVIDPSLIGGAIIDAGDAVFDGSVQARLHSLQQAIIR